MTLVKPVHVALLRVSAVIVALFLLLFAWLIWGPVGLLLTPLARQYGESFVPGLRLAGAEGSLYSGFVLNGIALVSGDAVLLSADRVALRPAWGRILRGELWLSTLEVQGVRTSAEDISTLIARFGGKDKPRAPIKPIHVDFSRVTLDAPLCSITLSEGSLTPEGGLALSGDLSGLPLRAEGVFSFAPLEVLSVDATIGSGRAFLSGRLAAPLGFQCQASGVRLGELLAALKLTGAEGDIDGAVSLEGGDKDLEVWGELRLSRGRTAGIPVEASLPWRYRGGDFAISGARVKTLSADIGFSASADLRPTPIGDRFLARGAARGVSMKKLGSVLPLGVNLEGEKGALDFWVSSDLGTRSAGEISLGLPKLKVNGAGIVKDLKARVSLSPEWEVTLDCEGQVFGAKVTGAGGVRLGAAEMPWLKAAPSLEASWRPSMSFIVKGLDSALAAAAFPALASLSPSGALDLTLRAEEQEGRLSAVAELHAPILTVGSDAAKTRLESVLASLRYSGGALVLENLKAKVNGAPLRFSGGMNLSTTALGFSGFLEGFKPASVPALADMEGRCDVTTSVQGTLASPRVTVSIAGENNRLAGLPIKYPRLSAVYANGKITIPETEISVAGGSLSLQGEAVLPKGGEPVLNLSGAVLGLDLAALPVSSDLEATGRLSGTLKVLGPVSSASLVGILESEAVSVGSADVRGLRVDFSGTARNLEIRGVRAKVNGGTVEGSGKITMGRRRLRQLQANLTVKGIEVRSLLAGFEMDAGIGGYLDGSLKLRGSLMRPEMALEVTSPLTVSEVLVDRLTAAITISQDATVAAASAARRQSYAARRGSGAARQPGERRRVPTERPATPRYTLLLNATGYLGDLTVPIEGHMDWWGRGHGWSYSIESGVLDLDRLVSAKMPSMKGNFTGSVQASLSGQLTRRRGSSGPISVLVSFPSASAFGAQLQNVLLPVSVDVRTGQADVSDGRGLAYGGKLSIDGRVLLAERQWEGAVKVKGLDLGQAAKPFMAVGALVGSADVDVQAKGDYGVLMTTFASGSFHVGEGYLHQMDTLKLISKQGRLSFQEIRGSFFWNGRDLWLNPGTQATANPKEPLYKNFAVNGALGIRGEGLALNCQGRFNVAALGTVLGALRGAFQLITGGLSGGIQIAREALGNLMGLAGRDFQDVSFQIVGNWRDLRLLDLKINKSLEGYLPMDELDGEPISKEIEKKLQFNIKIPVGPGGSSEESAGDQFKRQLLDNLLNQITIGY
ncbi:MAG: hypothetical protein LBD04_01040 [Synergistaceae bacterium]|jgi:hypothetical protein|nr:hypothetical protein [Synergistaceae bacterium]